MTELRRILKDYQQSGALHSLLAVHCAINQHTFLTKGGDLFCILQAKGFDYEGRDPAELDHVCRRFEAALRGFDENYRVYQYIVKRSEPDLPHRDYENPVVQEAVASRIALLRSRALYETDLYFVICYENSGAGTGAFGGLPHLLANPLQAVRERLSTQAAVAALKERVDRGQEQLANKVQGFMTQLNDTVKPFLLDKHQAFHFMRSLMNPAPHLVEGLRLKFDSHVDYQICASALECYPDHLRLGDSFVRVLTLKEPPSRTFPHLLQRLQQIDSNFVMVSEWKRQPNDRVRSLIQSQRRHHHNSKASLLNYAGNARSEDMLIDNSSEALVHELGRCLEELGVRGNAFGQFTWTVILQDLEFSRLKRSAAECIKVFSAHDAQLFEERYNLLNSFLAAFPGNRIYNLRPMWLSIANCADLSSIFALHSGETVNNHLQAEYLALFETNHNTPYFFNLHVQDVAHAIILGATGSGKSFLLSFILTNAQKYSPQTFIFDLGRGYKDLASLFGGSYLAVGAEERPFTINPFVLPPTPENLRFLFAFAKVLIESDGYSMTAPEEKDLYEQIGNLYAVEPAQRRLFTLANVLGRSLRVQLAKWGEGGPYASYFDNATDTLTLSRFQVFDFEGMSKIPAVLEALLFYILHRATASILDDSTLSQFKIFALDEAWRFLRHPTIKLYITEALKTWRKKNAAMLLATQSTDDLLHSGMLEVVAESCPTKIFLSNPGMNREAYRQAFHLTETEADLIAGLVPKQQFLVKRPDRTKVLNLHVDSKGYWLYTNDPYDNEKKREAFATHGFEQGLDILARSNS